MSGFLCEVDIGGRLRTPKEGRW